MPGNTVNDMILRVHLSNKPDNVAEIPISSETTCQDVIEMCKEPGEEHCHLAESFKGVERPVRDQEVITDILQQLGPNKSQVKFIFHHDSAPAEVSGVDNGINGKQSVNTNTGSVADEIAISDNIDLSVSDLKDMASWQQQQIGNQQQLLVAKQQRLKFLKHQEVKHQQEADENERLQKLREKVEAQEQKLKRLRSVQGRVDSTKLSNDSLSELDSVKVLFAEKEKELAKCFAKVEEMKNQLHQLKNTQMNGSHSHGSQYEKHDFDRLKKELLNRNNHNEKQTRELETQANVLNQRSRNSKDVDKRIEELKEMLRGKRSSEGLPPGGYIGNKNNNGNSRNIASGSAVRGMYSPPHVFQQQVNNHHSRSSLDGQIGNRNSPLANGDVSSKLGGNGNWRKPVKVTGGWPSESLQPSRQRQGLSPQGSPQQMHRPVPQPRRSSQDLLLGPRNRDDNSGSDTSSLTENSSLDSVPSTSGMPRPRSSMHGNRPPLSSPTQNVRNNSSYGEERRRSPLPSGMGPPSHGGSSNPNRNSIMQLAVKDPHTRQLQSRQAGNRSPMYIPSSPTDTKSWPQHNALGGQNSSENMTQMDGKPTRESQGNIPQAAFRHPLSPQTQRPVPAHRNNGLKPRPGTPGGHDSDTSSSRGSPNSADFRQSENMQPINHRRSLATVGVDGHNSGGASHPTEDKEVHDYDSELSDLSQQDENSMAAISADRPPSPIRDPTLLLHYHYPDVERLHYMPRPIKKRMSFTENKDENFSFMKSEYREKFMKKNVAAKANTSLKEEPENINYQETSTAKERGGKRKPGLGDEYSNDAILTHKQYTEALAMLSQLPILSPSSTRSAPQGILKREGKSRRKGVRVRFDPLALLLDASLEGEYDQVRRIIQEVPNPSDANDEGITALHNAICANHSKIVNFLILFGVDVNSPDSDGWTPLHCAASCNNLTMVRALVERGGCVFSTTISDKETPAEKCEKEEDGYLGCFEYLNDIQEKMGVVNNSVVFGVYSQEAENDDELSFKDGDQLKVMKKDNDEEKEWWWAKMDDKEGYVPRNLLALYPRVKPLFS